MALKKSIDLTNESVKLIRSFQSGKVKPIRTGKKHLDDALLGGLLPSTVLGICARSTHGKTYDLEQIQRFVMNTDPDVIFMNCAWEMEHFKLLVRDLSARTGKSVKDVLFTKVETPEDIDKFKEICDGHRKENIFYQNEPVSDEDFATDVEGLIRDYPNHKILVSIDNLENILNTKGSQKASMDALLYQVNRLKKIHPYICFIILNQLNGDYIHRMDDIKRQKPIETDIYGSEQLLKLCDVLYIKILPWKLGIKEKFMIFGRTQYDWLEDHKLPLTSSGSKTASFDPFGKAFYFYVKLRQPENERRIQDLFIEQMFTKEEAGYAEVEIEEVDDTPSFGKPTSPEIIIGSFNTTLHNSKDKGKGFDKPVEEDDLEPF